MTRDTGCNLIVLGEVTGVHGVHGQLKIRSFTDPKEQLFDYLPWRLDGELGSFEVREAVREPGKGLIAAIPGVEDREMAGRFVGAQIKVDRGQLPDNDEGKYYWVDLEGLPVTCVDGRELGKVNHLLETGAHDVLVVTGDRERLIPFVLGKTVVSVDLETGIQVDWDPDF